MSNTQTKLGKVRTPRVQITYDVETGGAESKKELPLVLGVVGDFAQQNVSLRDRNFLHIDKDNFNDVMEGMIPGIELLVDSVIPGKNGQLAVSLQFNSMEDFSPENVAMQVEPLKNLLALREQLTELRNRTASNDALKEQLVELLSPQGDLK
ncbi:type VI secretion system contractile sheath small subunit [Yersinia enterocolitica]|uniref:type VI secretion system contractile sheath small subunit n=1 Tax=Yersinia enterocolitica TaxID=630 RepID=UPI001C8D4592|nr:type VI secretion system contractile sheath small subunit [Yersinia enterocolitica]EKN4180595.1 type VI secretion system contractile sheath small subunit [Yersinia enterocolitica]MBX9488945.1 type VI secretion system contractile sheath small subunit [Yersinia enterocolitica]MBX9494216.1 type VI secretion system contractile sheath small subunit [Yersinia enterocolitica]HEN3447360.1 type VI secretion system contractile sheath small subunit [Yersinia enterocolitica]HEN3637200.1 type VI secreti